MDFVCSPLVLCQKEHRRRLPKIMSFSADLIIEDIMREREKTERKEVCVQASV